MQFVVSLNFIVPRWILKHNFATIFNQSRFVLFQFTAVSHTYFILLDLFCLLHMSRLLAKNCHGIPLDAPLHQNIIEACFAKTIINFAFDVFLCFTKTASRKCNADAIRKGLRWNYVSVIVDRSLIVSNDDLYSCSYSFDYGDLKVLPHSFRNTIILLDIYTNLCRFHLSCIQRVALGSVTSSNDLGLFK